MVVRDPDGETFVDPEAGVQLPGSKNRRQCDEEDQEHRDRDPVRQHDPPGACELDAGHAAKLAAPLRGSFHKTSAESDASIVVKGAF